MELLNTRVLMDFGLGKWGSAGEVKQIIILFGLDILKAYIIGSFRPKYASFANFLNVKFRSWIVSWKYYGGNFNLTVYIKTSKLGVCKN